MRSLFLFIASLMFIGCVNPQVDQYFAEAGRTLRLNEYRMDDCLAAAHSERATDIFKPIEMQIRIGYMGNVTNVQFIKNETKDIRLEQCIRNEVAKIQFAPTPEQRRYSIYYQMSNRYNGRYN